LVGQNELLHAHTAEPCYNLRRGSKSEGGDLQSGIAATGQLS